MSADLPAAARRLQLAFDLFRTGEDMMRAKLRREHPELSAREIEARLVAWLQTRPGAPSSGTRPEGRCRGRAQSRLESPFRRIADH